MHNIMQEGDFQLGMGPTEVAGDRGARWPLGDRLIAAARRGRCRASSPAASPEKGTKGG